MSLLFLFVCYYFIIHFAVLRTESHLAQLYSTSTMEHHHFDHCIMILTSNGNRILQRLSPEQYKTVIHLLESAILSTDLALYFKLVSLGYAVSLIPHACELLISYYRKKGHFANLVHNNQFNWESDLHRDTLR